jgi:hypothetical protein
MGAFPLLAVVEKVPVEGVRLEKVFWYVLFGFAVWLGGGAKGKIEDEVVRERLWEKVVDDGDDGYEASRCT